MELLIFLILGAIIMFLTSRGDAKKIKVLEYRWKDYLKRSNNATTLHNIGLYETATYVCPEHILTYDE